MSERNPDLWWDDLVEEYVDGTLPAGERENLDAVVSADATLASQIALSRAIRDEFKAMSEVRCPDSVVRKVRTEVRADYLTSVWRKALSGAAAFTKRQLRPVVAMAVLVLLVVVSTRIGQQPSVQDPAVAQALGDVKWTLAYLSKLSRETGSAVRSEALEPLVMDPMQQATRSFYDN